MSFEFLDHTADTAVRIRAPDESGLFREAARALTAIILDQAASGPVLDGESVPVRLEAEDGESLMVDFLNELIFLFDTRRFLAADLVTARVSLGPPARLEAVVKGETFDPARHAARTEVKAATFHEIEVRRTEGGLEVDVVFDL